MRRGDFEALADATLGSTARRFGFALTPQRPPDVDEPLPRAIFEALPADFARRFPRIMAHSDFEVSCIDLVLEYDPGSDELGIDVEGWTLNALRSLARLNPVGSPGQGDLGSPHCISGPVPGRDPRRVVGVTNGAAPGSVDSGGRARFGTEVRVVADRVGARSRRPELAR